ncbi:hypothetical protein V8F33_012026 [Rhypophila sp. PSN 637]
MAPSSTTKVRRRPVTTADLQAATRQFWRRTKVLDLHLIGENFISHVVATSGGKHILSRGPRGLRLPIEIWYMIIELLKNDSSNPGWGSRWVRSYPLDGSKVRVSFPLWRQPQSSDTSSARCQHHQFGSRDKITTHDTPSIGQDKVARARDHWPERESSLVPQDIDIPIVLPSPAAIPSRDGPTTNGRPRVDSQPTDPPARAGKPFDPIIPCLFVMVHRTGFRRSQVKSI